jgi:CelD/BcsL family acetyltransferase involved in cellulose biosynthesis
MPGARRVLPVACSTVLAAKFIVELGSLERLYAEWDRLAVSRGLPFMAPGWLLAWWRHVAPKNALLRCVEIRDGSELVGLAPFFVVPPRRDGRVTYRLLGIELGTPIAPLARRTHEWQVARAVSQALGQADPRPDLILVEGAPLDSDWDVAMRDGWPGRSRPIPRRYRTWACPTVSLQGVSLESWLAGRSSSFRSSMRRLKRRFDEMGGTWRMSTEATLKSDIEIFQRLHAARWERRGGSTLVAYGQRMGAMLNDAGRALIGDERFRLWVTEIDGEAIAADIYLCGGGTVLGFNGGWDERFKRLSPPLLATMHTIEDSINRGERRFELGPRDESHKTRFADSRNWVTWSMLMMPGRRLPRTWLLMAPVLAGNAVREIARRVLTPEQLDRLGEWRRKSRNVSRLPVARTAPSSDAFSKA